MVPPLAYADDLLFPADPIDATPLKVALHIALPALLKAKPDEEDLDGNFVLEDGTEMSVRVGPRGKSRLEHCSFPPLWLDFKKEDLKKTIFKGQNKLKLVTHCSRKFASREFLAHEMLAYRLLNVLTDYSFRVRAVEIAYIDTQGGKTESRYGFLIEHKKRLAKRLDAESVDVEKISMKELEADHAALISVFQYMIGNTDFSLRQGPDGSCCHNAVPIKVADIYLPVPYDFDASGFVNPPYAAPSPNLSIRRLTSRLYRGYCNHNDLIPGAVQQFIDKRDELLTTLIEFDDIPGAKSQRMSKFLASFYEVVESPKKRQSKLVKRCR